MTAGQARFVVLRHSRGPDVHWDLMIEQNDHLATWRMPVSPDRLGCDPTELVRIADHPLRFLTYQGSVQNDTAQVEQVDEGVCLVQVPTEGRMTLCFDGRCLHGQWSVTHRAADRWSFEPAPGRAGP